MGWALQGGGHAEPEALEAFELAGQVVMSTHNSQAQPWSPSESSRAGPQPGFWPEESGPEHSGLRSPGTTLHSEATLRNREKKLGKEPGFLSGGCVHCLSISDSFWALSGRKTLRSGKCR